MRALPGQLGSKAITYQTVRIPGARSYEARQSDEAIFAYAVDRLMPVLQNLNNSGQSWIENSVSREKVLDVNAVIGHALPSVWQYVESCIKEFDHFTPLPPGEF